MLFSIDCFQQEGEHGLEYYLGNEIVEYNIRSCGDFMEQNFKILQGRQAPVLKFIFLTKMRSR